MLYELATVAHNLHGRLQLVCKHLSTANKAEVHRHKSEMESIHLRIKSCTSLMQTNGIIFTTKAKVLSFWFALFAFFAQKVEGKCLQKFIFYMQNMYDSC